MLVNKLEGGKSVFLQHTTPIINFGSVHGYSGRTRRVKSPYMLVGRPTLRCLQNATLGILQFQRQKKCQIVYI